MDAATGSADRSRLLDRRRKEGKAVRQPYRRSLRPPCVPTLHAADRRPRFSLADRSDTPFRTSRYCLPYGDCLVETEGDGGVALAAGGYLLLTYDLLALILAGRAVKDLDLEDLVGAAVEGSLYRRLKCRASVSAVRMKG